MIELISLLGEAITASQDIKQSYKTLSKTGKILFSLFLILIIAFIVGVCILDDL
ncbi:hypothetical protein I2F27_00805 [Acinetobacter sp. B5B]|uniref:hypothetical protein n=1 Tax=Acinetobacter baretiae TaxID=2605383 RepID=UPI0018C27748|nr:hypothetical protein [Acinetobacter baretiae]MBF7681877.1 hypothetical protein [Acinetobacter baretiae]